MKNRSSIIGYLTGLVFAIVVAYNVLIYASTTPQFNLDNFSFTDLDGRPIDLRKIRGKAIVVNIWATWCGPCIAEMPHIENAYNRFKKDSVVFLIASDEPVEKIFRFKEKKNINLPFCSFTMKDIPVPMSQARPQTYIFNSKGELIYNRIGAFKWDDETVLNRLQSWFD